MAEVPEGAELLTSDHLIVPVVVVHNVHVFPGVPEIFRRKFDAIKERFRERPYLMRVVFVGVGEGTLAEHLNGMLRSFPELLCGSYPEFTNPEYKVRVTLESKESDYLERRSGTSWRACRATPSSASSSEPGGRHHPGRFAARNALHASQ